jgi:hypothetical protein
LTADQVSARRLAVSALLAAAVATAALIAVSHGHVQRMAYGDGLIYRYVASHLTSTPSQLDPVISEHGPSLRYGRIGFSALMWLTAAGRNNWIPFSQAALIILSATAAGAAISLLLPRAGPIAGLVCFLAPGFAFAIVGSYAEVLSVTLALWSVVVFIKQRWLLSASLLAAAMLTKETAVWALVGMIVWQIYKRSIRPAAIMLMSLIPVAAWYWFVAVRFGHIPILDPYLRVQTDDVGSPFVALGHALTRGATSSIIVAALHLLLALIAFVFWRRSIVSAVAAAAGLQIFSTGAFAWHYVADGMRTSTFLELFLLVGLLGLRWSAAQQPVSTGAS